MHWNTASKRRDLRWLAWCRLLVRPTRIKVLVHDGIGAWPAAWRLNAGKFIWPREGAGTLALTRPQCVFRPIVTPDFGVVTAPR